MRIFVCIFVLIFGLLHDIDIASCNDYATHTWIRNDTTDRLYFALQPVGGYWPTDRSSSEKEFVIFPETYQEFFCVSCGFLHMRIGEMQLAGDLNVPTGAVYDFQSMQLPGYYSFSRNKPHESIFFYALRPDRISPRAKGEDHYVTFDNLQSLPIYIGVAKSGGVWDPTDILIANPNTQNVYSAAIKLDLQPGTLTILSCKGCTGHFLVNELGWDNPNISLDDGNYEVFQKKDGYYSIRVEKPIGNGMSTGNGAASAAGQIYIVNAQSQTISFTLSDAATAASSLISLMPGEGTSRICPDGTVDIGTGSFHMTRRVQAGGSYMIVWDTTKQVYDLRVYSQ